MEREALLSDSVDPLSGLNGPSLFPRTVRAAADVPVPADSKDLDSIHNFMKSLELKSPQKLMNEAKKIVDGGAELLESDFVNFTEKVSVTNAIAAKGKGRPQERRPGLGLDRKRAQFSLKTSISQPSVNLDFDIDHIEDPDEFFDAYERMENAKKEIQKQLGGSMNINLYKPSNNKRPRRQGLLGRSYNYKHRYSSTPAENDDMWMSSQETVYENIPNAPKDESQEKLVHPDPNTDADLEEVELTESMKKSESEVNDILEELLSCNDEDLEGHGALNLLQERLNIKPLDLENLYTAGLHDVGRTNISTASESRQKPRKSSMVIDSVLKNLSKRPHIEQELGANPVNPVSSPTPPRSPFASISLLKKRILQPNPLRDPFSPLDIDHLARLNAFPAQPNDKLLEEVDASKDMGTSSELELHVEVGNVEPPISNGNAQELMGNADSPPEQFVDENASKQRANVNSRPNASPVLPKNKLLGQVDALKDSGMSSELESHVEFGHSEPTISHMDAQEAMGNEDILPEQSVDGNASIRSTNADSKPNAESDNNIGKTTNFNENESNPSVLEEEARVDTSSRRQIDTEESPQVYAAKLQRRKRVAGGERIRNAHPMRKSIAEAGTSYETGVRRSKRIKTRPLEYWKGERFLYGRVDNSMKLLGVRYYSPDKSNETLKVKPYILLETPELKQLLDLAARH